MKCSSSAHTHTHTLTHLGDYGGRSSIDAGGFLLVHVLVTGAVKAHGVGGLLMVDLVALGHFQYLGVCVRVWVCGWVGECVGVGVVGWRSSSWWVPSAWWVGVHEFWAGVGVWMLMRVGVHV